MQSSAIYDGRAPVSPMKRQLARDDDAYRQLLGAQNKAVLVLSEDLSVEDCNAQALALFRCSRVALIGKPAAELLPARQPDGLDSGQGLQQAIAAALEGLPQSLLGYLQAVDGLNFEALVQLHERIGGQIFGDVLTAHAFSGIPEHGSRVFPVDRLELLFHSLLRPARGRGKKTVSQTADCGLQTTDY